MSVAYTWLYRPKSGHVHDLPDCRTLNAVVRCNACHAILVLRWKRDWWGWVPLRWWHVAAYRGLWDVARAEDSPRYAAGGIVNTWRPMATNFPAHPRVYNTNLPHPATPETGGGAHG